MKTLIPVIPVIAALALFETAARCDEPTSVIPPQSQETVQKKVVTVRDSEDDAKRQFDLFREQAEKARRQFDMMDNQFASALDHYQKVIQSTVPGPAADWDSVNTRGAVYQNFPARRVGGSGRPSALVVRSAETDPTVQANLEEDLAVMLRVFDKAINEVRGNKNGRSIMGINVYFSPSVGPNRSLYLDGYGALFLVKVDFPLLPPPPAKDEPKEKPATDSSWEEARRELYGQQGNGSDLLLVKEEAEEYEADKIAKLKDGLVEALKSAANIRNLKSDDSITVCVFGGAGQRVVERKLPPTPARDAKPVTNVAVVNTPGRGSVLTIRARKSDVDAFAKGKLNLEEFRKKISLITYQGGAPDAWF